jgi:hypothetical protein
MARGLVDHYIDNILPDGFKAQVVCHSKLATIRSEQCRGSADPWRRHACRNPDYGSGMVPAQ